MGEKKVDRFLSVQEAAEFLCMNPSTFKSKVYQGLIKGYKVGRAPIFDAEDLRRFVKQHPVKR